MPRKSAHKKSSWRVAQSRQKLHKKTKLALLALGLIFAIIVIGQTVRLIQSFFQPKTLENGVSKNYLWNGNFRLNLVVKAGSDKLLSYDPVKKEVDLIDLPKEVYLNVPSNLGQWQLRSVDKLSAPSSNMGGNKLLEQSVASFLGLPVDGYIELGGELKNTDVKQMVDNLRQKPLTAVTALSNIKSDLSSWELMQLLLSLSGVRFDKISDHNLNKLSLLDEERLADGSKIFTADPIRMDSLSNKLADGKVAAERLTVAVFNATDHPGLAQKAARIISNLGGDVIISANADDKITSTQVVIGKQISKEEDLKKTATFQRLSQIFTLDCENKPKCVKINTESLRAETSRAQINVILGEDFYLRW